MASLNETIADRLRAHTISLLRVAADFRAPLHALLLDLETDLIAAVMRADLGRDEITRFQRSRLDRMLGQVQGAIRTVYGDIADEHDDYERDLAGHEAQYAARVVNGAASVDLIPGLQLTPEFVEKILDGTMIEGAPSRNWWEKQAADVAVRFEGEMRKGIVTGETNDQLVRRIRGTREASFRDGVMPIARRNAEALVRSSTLAVANQARQEVWEKNDDLIASYMQVSTLDSRTTRLCIARSGKRWDAKTKEPIGHDFKFRVPPLHWQCRSTMVPVTKTFRDMGIDLDEVPPSTRASIDGQVPADMSFDEWLKGKDEAFQNDLLGKGRADLFRSGKITLTDLVDQNDRPLTIAELHALTGVPQAANVERPPGVGPRGWETDTLTGKWLDASLAETAHPAIQRAIAATPRAPVGVSKHATAYYHWIDSEDEANQRGRIYMLPTDEPGSTEANARARQGTFRHEYGHYLDANIGGDGAPRSKGAAALLSDTPDFKHAQFLDAREIREGTEGKKAGKLGDTEKSFDVRSRIFNAREGDSAASPERRAFWNRELGRHGITFDDAIEIIRRDASSMRGEAFSPANAFRYDGKILDLVAGLDARDANRVLRVFDAFDRTMGLTGKFADLLAGLTTNDVGFGHSKDYMKQANGAFGRTEAFANVVALSGDDLPVWGKIADRFAPRFSRLVLERLEEHAGKAISS